MRRRNKIMVGLVSLAALVMSFGAWSWFNQPPPALVIADAGSGGERIMLGDVPANYFPGQGTGPRPAVLLLGGSEGGLRPFRNDYARALAAAGFSVLYPGYFATRESNRAADSIPLEIFDSAIGWLRQRNDIDPAQIAIIGHSKGAEAALLVASRNTGLAAVVAAMPSAVVWQGFSPTGADIDEFGSTWTIGGQPVDYVPYIVPAWYTWLIEGQDALIKMFRTSWAARAHYPEAAIPVERITAKVLLICGGQDKVWPSCDMARAARDRAANSGKTIELLEYTRAGHWGFGPVAAAEPGDRKMLGRFGGTSAADLQARQDQWPKVIAFLNQAADSKPAPARSPPSPALD